MQHDELIEKYNKIFNEIKVYLKEKYRLEQVYLLGSLYHGKWFSCRSDIDISIHGLPDEKLYPIIGDLNDQFEVRIDVLDYNTFMIDEYYREEKYKDLKSSLVKRLMYKIDDMNSVIKELKHLMVKYVETNEQAFLNGYVHNIIGLYNNIERCCGIIYTSIVDKENEQKGFQEIFQVLYAGLNLARPILSKKTYDLLNEFRLLKNIVCNLNIFHYKVKYLKFYINNVNKLHKHFVADIHKFHLIIDDFI